MSGRQLVRLLTGLKILIVRLMACATVLLVSTSNAQMLNFAVWQKQLELKFTTAAQTIFNKNCSGVVTVEARRSGVAYLAPANLTIDLTGPAGLTFYSDVACATAVTSVTIASGASSANFYFLDTTNPAPTITATATGTTFRPIEQTQTLTTNGFVWKGTLSSAWATAGNWSGGVVPSSTSRVVFDSTCNPNCSPTFSAPVTIRHLRMSADYTGTIAQGDYDITIDSNNGLVGDTGFVQLAGTFTGTTNPANFLKVEKGFATIAGGTFTAPVSTLTVTDGWTIINSPSVTFPSGSTLNLYCSGSAFCYSNTIKIAPSTVTYQNVNFNGRRTHFDLGGGTMTISGSLQVGDSSLLRSINNGTLNVSGDVSANTALGSYGSAVIVLKGNASGQTISQGSGGQLPPIELATGANPVTLSGTVKTQKFTVTSVGTFTSTGSTLNLYCDSGWSCGSNGTINLTLGSVTYNNLTINGYSTNWNFSGATVTVAGDLSIGDLDSSPSGERLTNGTINVYGNITATGYGYFGTAIVVAKGNAGGQTITGVTGRGFPHLKIDAGANPVTLSNEIRTVNYTYVTSGTFTTTGSTLRFYCANGFSPSCANQTVNLAFGTVTYNNLWFAGYSTAWDLGGTTFTVSGTLTLGDNDGSPSGERINNGTINATGQNITAIGYGYYGTALINAKGHASGQTITGVAGRGFPALNIDAGANPVTIVGTIKTADYVYTSSGTFTSTGSTVHLHCISGSPFGCDNSTKAVTFGNVSYNNVTLTGYSTNWDLGGDIVTVNGNLSFGDLDTSPANYKISNGTFNVAGNITYTNEGLTISTATIVATGNPAGQTISGVSGKRGLPLQINTGANPVTLGYYKTHSYAMISVGTFTTTGSTLEIRCNSGTPSCDNTASASIVPGSVTYNNVILDGYRTVWDLGGATFNIDGNLTMSDQSTTNKKVQNGTLKIGGNLTVGGNAPIGDAAIQFVGSGPQTITTSATAMPSGTITVNKPSGTLTLLANISWNQAGQSMTIASGTVDMAGFNLTVNNVLTIDAGATLTKNLGILTYGSIVNNGTLNP